MLSVGAGVGGFGHGEDGPDDGAVLAPGEAAAIGDGGNGELGCAAAFGCAVAGGIAFATAVGAADEAAVWSVADGPLGGASCIGAAAELDAAWSGDGADVELEGAPGDVGLDVASACGLAAVLSGGCASVRRWKVGSCGGPT